jgi:hypothetical protein
VDPSSHLERILLLQTVKPLRVSLVEPVAYPLSYGLNRRPYGLTLTVFW